MVTIVSGGAQGAGPQGTDASAEQRQRIEADIKARLELEEQARQTGGSINDSTAAQQSNPEFEVGAAAVFSGAARDTTAHDTAFVGTGQVTPPDSEPAVTTQTNQAERAPAPGLGAVSMPTEMLMAFSNAGMKHHEANPLARQSTLSPTAQVLHNRRMVQNRLHCVVSDVLGPMYFRNESIAERDHYLDDILHNKLEGFVKVVFLRALDAEGKRLFWSVSDYQEIMWSPDMDEIVEIGSAIYMFNGTTSDQHESGVTTDEAKKP